MALLHTLLEGLTEKETSINTEHPHCTAHDSPHETTLLTTGEYTYCGACADEKIEAKMQALRTELTTKGYTLGEAHADPERTRIEIEKAS